jgi:hypothetical protein
VKFTCVGDESVASNKQFRSYNDAEVKECIRKQQLVRRKNSNHRSDQLARHDNGMLKAADAKVHQLMHKKNVST